MSHHGNQPFERPDPNNPHFQNRQSLMRSLLNSSGFIGATGLHPDGRLTKQDEGAIQFAIGEQDGKVVIDFGTSVHWMAMTPQQAAELASTLLKRAGAVGRKNGETITFTVS